MSEDIGIICDDFRNVLPTIRDKYIIITDPPYNQGYHYDVYKDKSNEYSSLLSSLPLPLVLIHYPEETINLFPKLFGDVSQVVSWVYNSNTGKQHRLISWWGCKPNFKKVGQPYKNPKDKRIAQRIANGKTCKLYDWWEVNQIKNVSKEKTAHPCQIPEKVIENIVLTTTNPGDLIIDPFMGSGTALVVAKRTGRKCLGIDLSMNYCQIAKERLHATV